MGITWTDTKLTIAELFVITCTNGDIARFTSHNQNIVYGGNTYQAIPINRGKIQYHRDLQIDKVDISFGLVGIVVGGSSYTIPQIIRRELLREANVKIYSIDYVTLAAPVLRFDGFISGEIKYSRGICTVEVNSLLDKLKDQFPRIIYSELCNHKLYSSYCGLTKATWLETGTTTAGTTTSRIYANVFLFASFAEGYWVQGEIAITSGVNSGLSKMIVAHADGYVDVMFPFPDAVAVGVTFNAYPGCDKTGVTCDTKFSNILNFFGFEYIPKNEMIYY